MSKSVPIHIFAGFLGSRKTTLLKKALDYYKMSGRKAVVIMIEIGGVNLEANIYLFHRLNFVKC